MSTETDQAAARVSEAQVHQIADALWDDMIGASGRLTTQTRRRTDE